MDLRQAIGDPGVSGEPGESAGRLQCSAKGCRREATYAVRWNNPKLHSPERRKVWLACDEHEVTLRDFLSMRGFYRDTVTPSDLQPTDG